MAKRLAALGVVALCVLALALAAAGLSAPAGSAGSGEGAGTGSGDTVPAFPFGAQDSDLPVPSVPFVGVLFGLTFLVGWVAMVLYRGQVLVGGLSAWVLLGLTVVGIGVLAFLAGGPTPVPGNESAANLTVDAQGGGEGGTGAGSQSGRTTAVSLPGAVFGVAVVAVAAAVVALVSASGSVDDSRDDGTDPDDGSAVEAAVGEAAGRAADAIADTDDADLSNAVYEAWYEMATALDVEEPATATPGEFAAAARAAGLDRDAVADLTAVFEAVRYGDEPATDHEERALDALRRVERDAPDGETGGSIADDRSTDERARGGVPE